MKRLEVQRPLREGNAAVTAGAGSSIAKRAAAPYVVRFEVGAAHGKTVKVFPWWSERVLGLALYAPHKLFAAVCPPWNRSGRRVFDQAPKG